MNSQRMNSSKFQSLIDRSTPKTIFYSLTGVFFLFYVVQIPWKTTIQDVLLYAGSAIADKPLLFTSYHSGGPSGNIHLLHSVLLWVVYHLMPTNLYDSIWPAGLLSVISGTTAVGLTFLIWYRLGIQKDTAFLVAVIAGLIPSIWHHNLIGEVYSLELCFILLFLYFYVSEKYIFATIAFLCALLTTQLSAFSFTVVLLAPRTKVNLTRAFFIGLSALILYFIVQLILCPDFFTGNEELRQGMTTPSIAQSLMKIFFIVLLNMNLLLIFVIKGSRVILIKYKKYILGLVAAAFIPQLVLVLFGTEYAFFELGSFQLLLLWLCCLPAGLAINNKYWFRPTVIFAMFGLCFIAIWNWGIQSYLVANDRYEAGHWFTAQEFKDVKLVGNWQAVFTIAMLKNDWDVDKAISQFIDQSYPDDDLIEELKREPFVYVECKRFHPSIRSFFVSFFPQLQQELWDPFEITIGKMNKLYENDSVIIYEWCE